MNKTLPLLLLFLPGTLASSILAYYTRDISLLVFGSATFEQERLVMLALLFIQIAYAAGMARCIRRRHCASFRAGWVR